MFISECEYKSQGRQKKKEKKKWERERKQRERERKGEAEEEFLINRSRIDEWSITGAGIKG